MSFLLHYIKSLHIPPEYLKDQPHFWKTIRFRQPLVSHNIPFHQYQNDEVPTLISTRFGLFGFDGPLSAALLERLQHTRDARTLSLWHAINQRSIALFCVTSTLAQRNFLPTSDAKTSLPPWAPISQKITPWMLQRILHKLCHNISSIHSINIVEWAPYRLQASSARFILGQGFLGKKFLGRYGLIVTQRIIIECIVSYPEKAKTFLEQKLKPILHDLLCIPYTVTVRGAQDPIRFSKTRLGVA